MYTGEKMYDCWGFVEGEWLKGYDCGVKDGMICFIPDNDHRAKHYLTNEYLSYTQEKPE